MNYCIYLRKSRADAEAESRGEGETLARHEKALLELAKKLQINISKIHREIVSGETIASRPVMQQLLAEVEQKMWDGVLVMEVERLARGDTIDQGIVAQTFKYSYTKIITPVKTYDPNNEFDEEYFEFGLFMSRREYKTINRRLQNGRIASVKEGKYVGNKPPYGYKRIHLDNDKGFTLSPVDNEADVVRLIFELYTVGEIQPDNTYKLLGSALIAKKLNEMKIPTRTGAAWSYPTIRDILINPIYIGYIRWNWRKSTKKIIDGQVVVSRPRSTSDEYTLSKGLHPAIISEDTFYLAQKHMKQKSITPVTQNKTIKNPLAGIVVCGKCGHHMFRRPYGKKNKSDTLICTNPLCDNVSSFLELVEKRALHILEEWLEKYKLTLNSDNQKNSKISQINTKEKAIKIQKKELDTLSKQINKIYDLFEQGIYDTNTFIERSGALSDRINNIKSNIKILEDELSEEKIKEKSSLSLIPKIEKLLAIYNSLPSPKAKNDMLKEVVEKAVYTKNKSTRWHGSPDDFTLFLYPKIPTS